MRTIENDNLNDKSKANASTRAISHGKFFK